MIAPGHQLLKRHSVGSAPIRGEPHVPRTLNHQRLGQGTDFELLYSFAKGYDFRNLRVTLPRQGATLPSITEAYLCAFLYENEIHDLFGVKFPGLAIDFKGNFLKTRLKNPFVADRPLPDDPEQIPPGNCGPNPPAAAAEAPKP